MSDYDNDRDDPPCCPVCFDESWTCKPCAEKELAKEVQACMNWQRICHENHAAYESSLAAMRERAEAAESNVEILLTKIEQSLKMIQEHERINKNNEAIIRLLKSAT